ncbi:hypothetical protein FQN57_000797 [Myotisia sp. PD_48]|nr:hypothetical protein FQN57_000797 [Myotisia sp. PD_48]
MAPADNKGCCGKDTSQPTQFCTSEDISRVEPPGLTMEKQSSCVETGCCGTSPSPQIEGSASAGGVTAVCCSDQQGSPVKQPISSHKSEDYDGALKENPTCCGGTKEKCCDDSCLERLAIMECEDICGQSSSSSQDHATSANKENVQGSKKRQPCNDHAKKTRQRYGATLEALGCICRTLLEMNQQTCCVSPQSSARRRNVAKRSKSSASLSSQVSSSSISQLIESQFPADKTKCCSGSQPKSESCSTSSLRKASRNDGCCAKREPKPPSVKSMDYAATNGCCVKREPKPPSVKSVENAAAKGCCAQREPKPPNVKPVRNAAGCCAKRETKPPSTRSMDNVTAQGCCAKGDPKAPSLKIMENGAGDSCCSDVSSVQKLKAEIGQSKLPNNIDIEKGITDSEHVILSISGMTCSGCELKLYRALSGLPSIQNLKTSVVLSRAEFDLIPGTESVADIVHYVERTTEFKCEGITNSGSEIDIIPNIPIDEFLKEEMPVGVSDLQQVGKSKTVRVCFDANVIGVRDILSGAFRTPVELGPPRPDPTLEAGRKHVRYIGLLTLLSTLLTIPVLVMAWAPLHENPITYGGVSLALATLVQIIVAGPFYVNALKALVFSHVIEMDLLIVLSTSAAYIFSVVSFSYLAVGAPLSTGQFFETSTLLVTLIMVGRFVSALARHKAVESVSIRSLQAPTTLLVSEDGATEKEIDTRILQYGDIFKVLPDSRIPTDGTVITGSSEVDESMITGESIPVGKHIGSTLVAGSINGSGTLLVRLTRLPNNNSISAIAAMVDEAKLSKPKLQAIADTVAGYFVPVVVSLMVITLAIWVAIGLRVRKQSASDAVIQAVIYGITVLIVSCPCAIGLAVPMVIVIAGGVAADHGVVIKSADAIETATRTSHIVFDKTGTLTRGQLSVAAVRYPSDQKDTVRSLILGLVSGSKHPVSFAVAAALKEQGVDPAPVKDVTALTSKGVEGMSEKGLIRAGNSRWLQVEDNTDVQTLLTQGLTVFCVTVNGELVAIFGLEDSLRPEAMSIVSRLRDRGIQLSIVSGDDDGAVRSVASKLGIDNIRSRCSPADKQRYLMEITTSKKQVIIFCGDGTNDAVALAQATIGVHINETSDVAQSAADVVLVRPSLNGLIFLIDLSKASVTRIAFNFTWSFIYNLFAILLAAGAFVRVRIPPEYAGLGELISVLPVILIALQLKWAKFQKP